MKVLLYIDGASRGNPGPAGIGIVLRDETGQHWVEIAESIGCTTNNIAEYQALIRGLEEARKWSPEIIEVYSDSELLVRQMRGQYAVRSPHLREYHRRAMELVQQFSQVTFQYIPRRENSRADQLASLSAQKNPSLQEKEKAF